MKLSHAAAIAVLCLASSACADKRIMPAMFMPDPPKECEEVMGFEVKPLPTGKSNAAKLSVDMAKEGAARQEEHVKSKVCASYALRTAGVMKDGERNVKPGEPMVDSASSVTTTKKGYTRKGVTPVDGEVAATN